MILESGKLYRVRTFTEGRGFPVLEIKGSANVYVSTDTIAPLDENGDLDKEKMVDVSEEVTEGVNTLTGLIRYIAVEYESGSEVKESGIVSSPKTDDRK